MAEFERCDSDAEYPVHEYSEGTCPKCGRVFCFSCCGGTNVHQGGKYEPDWMECPACGTDVLEETDLGVLDH